MLRRLSGTLCREASRWAEIEKVTPALPRVREFVTEFVDGDPTQPQIAGFILEVPDPRCRHPHRFVVTIREEGSA